MGNLHYKKRLLFIFSLIVSLGMVSAFSSVYAEQMPEPDPPVIYRIEKEPVQFGTNNLIAAAPTTEWTFHKTADNAHPDGNEQQMMWLMNRARSDPSAEGLWLATTDEPLIANSRDYFDVDIDMLQSEFDSYPVKPPAAFDVRLYNAAKAHSEDLIARDAQDHTGQFDRIEDAGFNFGVARGNVFSYSKSALHAHGGFNIDWGPGPGNMQTGRGHRISVMSLDDEYCTYADGCFYSNVGIAMVSETNPATEVGPLVTTGNYCQANTSYPDHYNRFIVGTVWEDANGNSMYDPGEGKAGVTVMPDSGTYFAVTSDSGGYAIPVEPGTYNVSFTGASLEKDYSKTVVVGDVSASLDVVDETSSDPGQLQFSSPAYSVQEGDGAATITVTRTNGSDGQVTVCYATSNGTAAAGADYTATSGTLTFNDGETSKTFNIPILDDAPDEDPETVLLSLSNPSGGATLGTPENAVLTIIDAATIPLPLLKGWNLISLPLSPFDPTIGEVLNSIENYNVVWGYQNGNWMEYDPDAPGSCSLNEMDAGYGYWIEMSQADILQVGGTAADKTVGLQEGWNLVGYNSILPASADAAFATIGNKLEIAWAFRNGRWLMYDRNNPMLSDLDILTPGTGCWVKVSEACSWTLPQ